MVRTNVPVKVSVSEPAFYVNRLWKWIMDNQKLDRALDQMVNRLVKRFDPEQIILFGSHARGTASPESDIDLLVVLPLEGSKRAKQVEMRVALHDIRVPKDIVVATPEEVARQRNIVGTVIRPALREGQVLYERQERNLTRAPTMG
jgi:predicted nucleotidyltransferase